MEEKLTLEEGIFAVKMARKSIESFLNGVDLVILDYPEKFKTNRGVFVSLYTYPQHNLRGCIGIPEPIMPLVEALKEAAISAAVNDPRFPPLTINELPNIVVEVSVLTVPKLINVSDPIKYLDKIIIGRDGLIIEYMHYRGLLLPQVPVEYGWDVKTYLENLCLKAGLPPNAWLEDGVKIYSFQAQVFAELSPDGPIVEKKLIEQ